MVQEHDPTVPPREAKAFLRPMTSRLRRPLILLGEMIAFLLILILLGTGLISVRLLSGPLTFEGLNQIVISLMESSFDHRVQIRVDHTVLAKDESGIKLIVRDATITDQDNQQILTIPETQLSLDGFSLLSLNPRPRSMDFIGLSLRLTLYKAGHVALSLSPVGESEPNAPAQSNQDDASDLTSPIELTSLIDAIFDNKSVFGLLQNVHIHDGSIHIEDKRSDHSLRYQKTDLQFTRTQSHQTLINISAVSAKGPWSARANMQGQQGQERQLSVSFKDLAISEVLGFAEPGLLPISTDMPLSFDVDMRLSPQGSLRALKGEITGGKARLIIKDPDATPIEINALSGRFEKSENGEALLFPHLLLSGEAMRWQGSGKIEFPQKPNAPWTYAFSGQDSTLSLTQLNQSSIIIDQWSISGELGAHFEYLTFQPVTIKGPDTDIRLGGTLGNHPDFEGLSLTVRANRMPARHVLAYWPSFVASTARTYLIRRLQSGMVEQFDLDIHLSPDELKASFNNQSIADESLLIKANVVDGHLQADEGLPLLTNLTGTVRVTGKEAHVLIDKGEVASKRSRKLAISNAHYAITDTARVPSLARVTFKVKGPADALFEALQAPALTHLMPVEFAPDQIHGQTELQANIVWPQSSKPAAQDIKAEAQGVFNSFAIDRVFGKERLDNGEMKFTLDANGFFLKGDAKIAGASTQINYQHKSGQAKPLIHLQLALDETARTRFGFKWGAQIQGLVPTKITIPPEVKTQGSLIEADLTRASINGALPGWTKPPNKSAKLTLRVHAAQDDSYSLKEIMLDGGAPMQMRGEAEFSPEGHLIQARFPSVRISPNDEMRVELDRVGALTKIQIRANQMDLRPFLKHELSSTTSSSPALGDFDLDLKANSLMGSLNQSMQQADLRLANRNGEIKDFRLSARFEQQLVSGQMGKGENGQSALLIESGNAGDLLRFLDLYRRMQGGRILLQIAPGGEQRAGVMIVNDFIIKDDPALAGVAQIKYPSLQQPLESGSVNFTKLRAQFVIGGGRFTLSDAVMWGPAIGGTLEGLIDYNADKTDLTGVFVPLYGLNNMLTQVPILGPLLLGGTSGGIFGINFRVSGTTANPNVTINPLSAVAPGIFRKLFLFGVGKPFDGKEEKPVPPGALPSSPKPPG